VEQEGSRIPRWLLAALAVIVMAGAATAVVLAVGGGEEEAEAQTVRFQEPTERGPDPFTRATDRHGRAKVKVGSGPFGGTGSDLVCDRELLISSLRARSDRMREWARVLDVEPTISKVASYIRKLRPVTLTRDTRVTNHSFVDGRAVGYQAILQAGTAVLVDKDGKPVARCRCGNPLLEPVFIEEAKCVGCPPNYRPPPPCDYYDYDDVEFDKHGDGYWRRTYDPADFEDTCYRPNPSPPRVRRRRRAPPVERPEPAPQPATNPSASFSPAVGRQGDRFTLSVTGFRPGVTLAFRLVRPDGVVQNYSIRTRGDGSGGYVFNPSGGRDVTGTYTATVTDPGTGDRAAATARLLPAAEEPQPPPAEEPDQGGLQCDPPRSQEEFELCNQPQEEPDAGAGY
jgi:hypothetical protein